ncbi:MAG: CCA tRNA nucleotidyltransferase [Elusimicrobia bacterium]|nr:CCA tRNA nucleotidyltransferase [Elusimicrobiota bacterium]
MVKIPSSWTSMVKIIGAWASGKNISIWVVGGCVRDWILKRPTKDLDLVVEKGLEEVSRFCSKKWGGTLESFGQFGTKRLYLRSGLRLDLARTRAEIYSRPAVLPEVSTASLEKDLWRRDFTVNAMAVCLNSSAWGELVDHYGGCADLKKGLLRVLHAQSFRDDPTRIWRAARFLGRFGFRLESSTQESLEEAVRLGYPRLLSRERVRGELMRILEEKDPTRALGTLKKWGLTPFFHPKFRWDGGDFKDPEPYVRLGVICLKMGESGKEFLRSLNLERPVSQAISAAFEVAERLASPRMQLPELSRKILVCLIPHISPSALAPLRVNGRDLSQMGIPSGREYSQLLTKAAQAQWRGEFSNRSEALRWLRRLHSRR